MDIITLGIIIIVLMAVSLILVRIFLKNVFRVLSIIWLIFFIIGAVYGLLLYADVVSLQKACAEMPPALVLHDDGKVLAGIKLSTEEPEIIENLTGFQEASDNNNYDALIEDYCKVAMVSLSAFENLSDVQLSDDITFPGEKMKEVIVAEDPVNVFVDTMIEQGEKDASEKPDLIEEVGDEFGSNEKLRGYMFGFMIAKAMEDKGPTFLVENSNSGKIKFYKETILFKTLKYFPSSLFGKISDRMMEMDLVKTDGITE